jgi:hypothetical protein
MLSTPQSSADVPLLIKSANSGSERRVSPAWTIAHLKTRLEPITGIPASAQKLSLRVGSQDAVALEAADEEKLQLSNFALQAYAEIFVSRRFYFPIFHRDSQDCPKQQMNVCHMCGLAFWKDSHAVPLHFLLCPSIGSFTLLFTSW